MDSVSQAIQYWQMEMLLAISLLAFVFIYQRSIKLWLAREGISLVSLLGVSLAIVTLVFLCLRDRIHLFGNRHALLFILLYCWCALGTVFLASRQTHAFKLFVGILLQGAIVYELYRWV